jgi:solute:Na+ symporter, SSS family
VGLVIGLSPVDWVVLGGTLLFITAYGAWKSRAVTNVEGFVRGDLSLRWPTIGLSIMATQASAITFLSTPGQAFEDGMRFVQFYFGLPLAMIVISAVFVPVYARLKVRTAYEYLEHRFDLKVRLFGGLLFLLGRGLAAGITIYAPAIILSQLLGWPLGPTIWGIGILVIVYTVLGGTQAVSVTQKQQMIVMMGGMVVAAVVVVLRLPDGVSLGGATKLAGALGRMNVVSFDLDFESRYNFWSGIAGGFFLALSYFGTDQSQVSRYLGGKSVAESRLGLLFNGMFKVPMQFLILFTGVMVFVFYVFTKPPLHFHARTLESLPAEQRAVLEARHDAAFAAEKQAATDYLAALGTAGEGTAKIELVARAAAASEVRQDAKALIKAQGGTPRDTDYVFLTFVVEQLPVGLIGLLMAVILCAAMSSVSSELIALSATTTVDFYLRLRRQRATDEPRDLRITKWLTVAWGGLIIAFASSASLFENLIEAVNILGSLFYGTILGLFVVAFFLPKVKATPVFVGGLLAQATVTTLFFTSDIGFLWFNAIGTAVVVVVSLLVQALRQDPR